MQGSLNRKCISLEKQLFPIKSTSQIKDALVVDEAMGFEKDFENANTKGGFFDLSTWGVIEISGPDALDYLQRMTTVDFKKMPVPGMAEGAFLTGKGGVVCLGTFRKISDSVFNFILPYEQMETALEHIEKFHFQEQLTVLDKSSEFALIGFWNPRAEVLKDMGLENLAPMHCEWRRWKSLSLEIWRDKKRPLLYWIQMKRAEAGALMFELSREGFFLLGMKLFHFFRLLGGIPWVGSEIAEKDIILEAGLEDAVSRNKGCYPGQEVVERIFTYGSVNRKIRRVQLQSTDGQFPECPAAISKGETAVGLLISKMQIPGNEKLAVGLAFIKKEFWDSQEMFSLPGQVTVKIS